MKSETKNTHRRPTEFPAAWQWFIDEALPTWVKNAYSPRESWKNKPFSQQDVGFFTESIQELSEIFTIERRPDRRSSVPSYFQHPKFRSAYLLYFLPLQAAKFFTLLQLHPKAAESALRHGQKEGVLRISDLGSGPGTASIAFLLWLLHAKDLAEADELPPIELDWYDTNRSIMEDGKALVALLAESFPRLRSKVSVRTHVTPWWSARIPHEQSLIFLGHVLNEAPPKDQGIHALKPLIEKMNGGGILFVEPAARTSSQLLSFIRDQLIESHTLDEDPSSIWGPCLQMGRCPLSMGRDWCHFSVPAEIPGEWFKAFSRAISAERHWVKFSYLWLSSSQFPAPKPSPYLRRVISDPLRDSNSSGMVLLICEPDRAGRVPVPPLTPFRRGDLFNIHKVDTKMIDEK